MNNPNFKTAEQWEIYEKQIATDQRNFALCRAHVEEARGQWPEYGYRVLALRATAQRIRPTADFDELKARQRLRFTFYKTFLDSRENRQRARRKAERQRETHIADCVRYGWPITWPIISMVWDKSHGHAVAVKETIYAEKTAINPKER